MITDVLIGLYLIAGVLVSISLVLADQAKSSCPRDDIQYILYGILRYIGTIVVWPIVLLVMAISTIE